MGSVGRIYDAFNIIDRSIEVDLFMIYDQFSSADNVYHVRKAFGDEERETVQMSWQKRN